MSAGTPHRPSALRFVLLGVLITLALAWAAWTWLPGQLGYRLAVSPKAGWKTLQTLDFSTTAAPRLKAFPEDSRPRNLILMIGDGMGFSQLMGARASLVGPNGRLTIERFPETAWSATHSRDRMYTDSAAGATALAGGEKTDPGRVGTDSQGAPLTSLYEKARERGLAVGTLTDSMIFDATPASFLAHRESRREYLGIAEDALALAPEVLIGETRRSMEESEAWAEMWRRFDGAGYHRLDSKTRAPSTEAPLLGLYPAGSIASRDADRQAPTLAELTRMALNRLARDSEGFVLLVETEETDSGGHNGDFDRTVAGIEALDEAAKVAVSFAQSRGDDTLIVVTADHETGGLALLLGEDQGAPNVRWATSNHSSEPVPVLAYGPGSRAFRGVLDNTEVGRLLAEMLLEDRPAGDGRADDSDS